MSIAGGVILYTGAIDNAPNANIRDLVINVSASLLSIPLVFLLYDYTNSRINSQMKKTLANSLSDKLNTLILNIIMTLRESMSIRTKLTPENLNRMLILRAPEISRRQKMTLRILQDLHTYHDSLDTLLYRNSQSDVLTPTQVQILSGLTRDITHLINENKFRRNKHIASKYTENIMNHILDWLDSDALASITIQAHLSPNIVKKPGKTNKK